MSVVLLLDPDIPDNADHVNERDVLARSASGRVVEPRWRADESDEDSRSNRQPGAPFH